MVVERLPEAGPETMRKLMSRPIRRGSLAWQRAKQIIDDQNNGLRGEKYLEAINAKYMELRREGRKSRKRRR